MTVMIEDDPIPVKVCDNCGVTDVGRPHTFIQCIHNLRDLLRRDHNPGLTITEEELKFVSDIKSKFTYESKRTRKQKNGVERKLETPSNP